MKLQPVFMSSVLGLISHQTHGRVHHISRLTGTIKTCLQPRSPLHFLMKGCFQSKRSLIVFQTGVSLNQSSQVLLLPQH